MILFVHILAAIPLFFIINWIGHHAVDFGYSSTSLFDDGEESIALNIFVKSLLPTVFIIILSAIAVSLGHPELRLGITTVVYAYFSIRFTAIFFFDRARLVSWPKFIAHAGIGITLSHLAYESLILPNVSLLPDLKTVGNELWLAIFAFLYAIANKVPLPSEPAARRKNSFIRNKMSELKAAFGAQIDQAISDDLLKLLIYSVAVAEDYARPKSIRFFERLLPHSLSKTTGIMQVRSEDRLSDSESVAIAVQDLRRAWQKSTSFESAWERFEYVVGSHNRDRDYIWRVADIAEIIAKRADPSFEEAYARLS